MQLSHFPSRKLRRTVYCESSVEADFALLLDCDPDAITYCEQPITVTLNLPNGRSQYTPDFMCEYSDGSHLVWEVKAEGWWYSPYWWERLGVAKLVFENMGFEYRVITDAEIRCTHFVSNLRLIYPRTHSVSHDRYYKVKEFVEASEVALTVADAAEVVAGDFDAVATYAFAHCQDRLSIVPFNNSFLLKGI